MFDSEFLKKLEYLALVSRRAHRGQMLANRVTRQHGSGLEFADHRQYTAGDDFRYLDWTIFARYGELLLKRFHEERDLRVDLLLDTSPSMDLGTPKKLEYGCRVTACMAYLALAHLDRVSVTAFNERSESTFPVTRGKHQWLKLLNCLERVEAAGADTQLASAIDALMASNRSGGLAIIVSDFLTADGYERNLDRLRYQGFEVFIVHIIDPLEADPSGQAGGLPRHEANRRIFGDVELVDAETGERKTVTIQPSDLKQYRLQFEAFQRQLQAYATHHGMGYLSAATTIPYDELVLQTMRRSGWLSQS